MSKSDADKPNPLGEDQSASTAAQMRALAAQADAEAAEAEALAAAARARARAIQLRQQADLVEAAETAELHADRAAAGEVVNTAGEGGQLDARLEDADSLGSEDDGVEEDAEPAAAGGLAEAADKPAWYRRRGRPKASTVATVLAIVVILAGVAGIVFMVLEHRDAAERRQLAAEFAAAARQGVVTLTSMDFNHAQAGVQAVIDNSIGSFKDDFAKTASDFKKVVEDSQVVERGTVQAAAVDLNSMTQNSAVVLVATTSEVTNAAGAKQDPRKFRFVITLARVGDQLKMSKVEFVP